MHFGTLALRLRWAGTVCLLALGAAGRASAQDSGPSLVFTAAVPERSRAAAAQVSTGIDERGLTLWSGGTSDFGAAITLSRSRWTLRSIVSPTTRPAGARSRASVQQVEVLGTLWSSSSAFVAGGGGIRDEWMSARTIVGRVVAGSRAAGGRLQGSLVLEHAMAAPRGRDAADVVTTIGWSRRIGARVSLGLESIGQDLEGLWDPAEADGGARLLVGPSLQMQSTRGTWAASFTAGPVVHKPAFGAPAGGHHFGIFASANWMPSLHR